MMSAWTLARMLAVGVLLGVSHPALATVVSGFLMTDDVPSEARLVRIAAPVAAPMADDIGGVLRVEKTPDDVALQWRQGPLNPSRYSVYRSSVAASLALAGARIASEIPHALTKDEVFRDPGAALTAAPDLYFYRVLGRACDGSPVIP